MRPAFAISILTLLLLLGGATAGPGEEPGERKARDSWLMRALDELRVVREAESIVLAHVVKVHKSPGIWCGLLVTKQEVTYAIDETIYGTAAEGEVKIGHLLVSGTLFVEKDEPYLKPSLFYPGARMILMLHKVEGKWQAIDESYGIRFVDPPRVAGKHVRPLLRKLFDLQELQPYLHPEVKGRVPVVVELTGAVPVPVVLTKFGKKVLFVPPELVRKRARFVISEVRVEGETATVKFGYPAEGVVGIVRFQGRGESWTVIESSVIEK